MNRKSSSSNFFKIFFGKKTNQKGTTEDKWYEAAAVLIWPKAFKTKILPISNEDLFQKFSKVVNKLKSEKVAPTHESWAKAKRYADALLLSPLTVWEPNTNQRSFFSRNESMKRYSNSFFSTIFVSYNSNLFSFQSFKQKRSVTIGFRYAGFPIFSEILEQI